MDFSPQPLHFLKGPPTFFRMHMASGIGTERLGIIGCIFAENGPLEGGIKSSFSGTGWGAKGDFTICDNTEPGFYCRRIVPIVNSNVVVLDQHIMGADGSLLSWPQYATITIVKLRRTLQLTIHDNTEPVVYVGVALGQARLDLRFIVHMRTRHAPLPPISSDCHRLLPPIIMA